MGYSNYTNKSTTNAACHRATQRYLWSRMFGAGVSDKAPLQGIRIDRKKCRSIFDIIRSRIGILLRYPSCDTMCARQYKNIKRGVWRQKNVHVSLHSAQVLAERFRRTLFRRYDGSSPQPSSPAPPHSDKVAFVKNVYTSYQEQSKVLGLFHYTPSVFRTHSVKVKYNWKS